MSYMGKNYAQLKKNNSNLKDKGNTFILLSQEN